MKVIKNTINILMIILILIFLIFNKQIINFINNNYIHIKSNDIYLEKNDYAKEIDYEYVKITDDFVASNYQELLNIFYTVLDSGTNKFTFYCDSKYKKCLDDLAKILPNNNDNNDIMSELNNFVHPFNTYNNITLLTTDRGKVTITLDRLYTNDMIDYINNFMDNYIKENINPDMSDYNKIKTFHDYIINNTSYDINRANEVDSEIYRNSSSHTAFGILQNHLALCGGYSDIMAIYLNKINIPNIKIAAKEHVWNLVYIDSNWLNLDVTWDDPVTNTGIQLLIYEYFLIDSNTLLTLDNIEHDFNKKIYLEAN